MNVWLHSKYSIVSSKFGTSHFLREPSSFCQLSKLVHVNCIKHFKMKMLCFVPYKSIENIIIITHYIITSIHQYITSLLSGSTQYIISSTQYINTSIHHYINTLNHYIITFRLYCWHYIITFRLYCWHLLWLDIAFNVLHIWCVGGMSMKHF